MYSNVDVMETALSAIMREIIKEQEEKIKKYSFREEHLSYKVLKLEKEINLYEEINSNQIQTIEQQRKEMEKHKEANKTLEMALKSSYNEEDRLKEEIVKLQDTILQLKESESELSREISYYKCKWLPFTEEQLEEIPRHILEERGLLNES